MTMEIIHAIIHYIIWCLTGNFELGLVVIGFSIGLYLYDNVRARLIKRKKK